MASRDRTASQREHKDGCQRASWEQAHSMKACPMMSLSRRVEDHFILRERDGHYHPGSVVMTVSHML